MSIHQSRLFKATCSTLLAGALLAAVAPTAGATTGAGTTRNAAAADGAYIDLASEGYTYEEAVEAFKDSDAVQVVKGDIPDEAGPSTRGVTLGWYVYVRISQKQARAIMFGSAATAAGIIGTITGGIGGAVAAGVYSYVASLGSDNLAKCKKGVEMRFSYLAKFKGAKCLK
ncbi:hypothetical protein DY218_06705 [Streptomyces triticagri]|uniref:Secreted protein n=1 Tax=Streptomyces triticagri TaxID=2293568 RepID=A0A372M974_9ACTN|nr:hypothetical protein [Streptomyces triticagri]RFU87498.1 hypothetical protein DY218_06705 [Streptomyces triticagri]